MEWDLPVTDRAKSEAKYGGQVTSVSVPLRNFYYARKHERSRRETETDVS